jgi:hypothetical protein
MRAASLALLAVLGAHPALAADWSQPAPASQMNLTAYGELGAGWARLHAASGSARDGLTTLEGAGYANLSFAERWNTEVEGRGYQIDNGGSQPVSDSGVFAHVYWRDPEKAALGAFIGYDALGLYGQHGDMVSGGVEGQLYFGNLTLYGQGGLFNSSASSGWLYFDGGFVRGTARYFATPNLRFQFDAQWAALNNSDHTYALTLVGTAEYRLNSLPLSGFARVRWDMLNPDLNQDMDTTTVLFGIRGYFGTDSLIGNDRHGPAMDVLPFPPLYALNFG